MVFVPLPCSTWCARPTATITNTGTGSLPVSVLPIRVSKYREQFPETSMLGITIEIRTSELILFILSYLVRYWTHRSDKNITVIGRQPSTLLAASRQSL